MAGLFALSIDSALYAGKFGEDLVRGLSFNQHRNERNCGFSFWDGKNVQTPSHGIGLILKNFGGLAENFIGTAGIGYCGDCKEPLSVYGCAGIMSLCFSGDVSNETELLSRLYGRVFARRDAIEILANLIAEQEDAKKGILELYDTVRGDFALLILNSKGVYVTLSPNNHKRLVLGEKTGAVAVSSESAGLFSRDFKLVREIKPGEILLLKNGTAEVLSKGGGGDFCVQQWIDRAFCASIIAGAPVSQVRKALCARLAWRDIENGFIPDVVTYPPNSARSHAIGYHGEFLKAINAGKISRVPFLDELLHKYPYSGRSKGDDGVEESRINSGRLIPSSEVHKGKIVVLCKASLTTGLQTKEDVVPKLRSTGVKEIHLRVSSPKILSLCRWRGRKSDEPLLSERFSGNEEIANFMGVESVAFNSVEDIFQIMRSVIEDSRIRICCDCSV